MTKPTVFNYKAYEELRQAYKDLLSDNQTLMADNRKLRAEVEKLKKTNAGYTKVLAKSQETADKFARIFVEEMEIITFPDGTTRRVCGVPHGTWEERSYGLVSVCSECGSVVLCKTWFCPHCGAIMDGGKSE